MLDVLVILGVFNNLFDGRRATIEIIFLKPVFIHNGRFSFILINILEWIVLALSLHVRSNTGENFIALRHLSEWAGKDIKHCRTHKHTHLLTELCDILIYKFLNVIPNSAFWNNMYISCVNTCFNHFSTYWYDKNLKSIEQCEKNAKICSVFDLFFIYLMWWT